VGTGAGVGGSEANIVVTDIGARNGVIHLIDTMLDVPPASE